MNKVLFFCMALSVLIACSGSKNLEPAKRALDEARNCPEVQKYAQSRLQDAEKAYSKAGDTMDDDDAYVAKRKAQMAIVEGKAKAAEQGYVSSQKLYEDKMLNDAKERDEALRKALAEQERLLKEQEAQRQAQKDLEEALKGIGEVKKEERGLVVYISDVLFDVNKADLREPTKAALTKMSSVLARFPQYKIDIGGHTDSTGSDQYNQKLSEKRAQSVGKFLVENQIASERVSMTGYGETKPIATNETREGRQRNRRVEIIVAE